MVAAESERLALVAPLQRVDQAAVLGDEPRTPLGTALRDAHGGQPVELVENLPLDEGAIRKALASRGIGKLEIKKRGVDITPEQLRPKLKLKGEGAASLILTKVGDARRALIVQPIRV